MKVPQSIWDATVVAPASPGDLRFMPLLVRPGARYCDVCGHEYCRFTYSWWEFDYEHGFSPDDRYEIHCNRSGSSWPPAEGPKTEPKNSDDYYNYSMGCCKCKDLWGKTTIDGLDPRQGEDGSEKIHITKPGPNGTRVRG